MSGNPTSQAKLRRQDFRLASLLRYCDTRESVTSSRSLTDTGCEDMRKRQKSDTMDPMKRRLVSLALVIVGLGALSGCVARRSKAALRSYSQVLKLGMTRKDVEDYFRANKIQFSQMCCVESSRKHSFDDLVKIGTQHLPVPCGDNSSTWTSYLTIKHSIHPWGLCKPRN